MHFRSILREVLPIPYGLRLAKSNKVKPLGISFHKHTHCPCFKDISEMLS